MGEYLACNPLLLDGVYEDTPPVDHVDNANKLPAVLAKVDKAHAAGLNEPPLWRRLQTQK